MKKRANIYRDGAGFILHEGKTKIAAKTARQAKEYAKTVGLTPVRRYDLDRNQPGKVCLKSDPQQLQPCKS